MKKKLLVFALILTALVSLFTVSALAAEDSPALEIKGANLSFADSVYIRYAVSTRELTRMPLPCSFGQRRNRPWTTM